MNGLSFEECPCAGCQKMRLRLEQLEQPTPIRARARDLLTPEKIITDAIDRFHPGAVRKYRDSIPGAKRDRLHFTLPLTVADGVDPVTAAERREHDRRVEPSGLEDMAAYARKWEELFPPKTDPGAWLFARPTLFALGCACGCVVGLIARGGL